MKRFLVAIPEVGGGVAAYPMKTWLREHPQYVPAGCDATSSTSHKLRGALKRDGWTIQELDDEVRLIRPDDAGQLSVVTTVLGSGDEDADEPDDMQSRAYFALEHQLRDFLAENIETVQLDGRRLKLYVDATGRDGIEYSTDVGFIDILAVDESGDFVVFELKRGRTADRAIGQLTRYMGWVKHTIGRGKRVGGVVVAREINDRIRFAASVIPDVALLEYVVDFKLTPAHQLPG